MKTSWNSIRCVSAICLIVTVLLNTTVAAPPQDSIRPSAVSTTTDEGNNRSGGTTTASVDRIQTKEDAISTLPVDDHLMQDHVHEQQELSQQQDPEGKSLTKRSHCKKCGGGGGMIAVPVVVVPVAIHGGGGGGRCKGRCGSKKKYSQPCGGTCGSGCYGGGCSSGGGGGFAFASASASAVSYGRR